jgi:hypothetical protein
MKNGLTIEQLEERVEFTAVPASIASQLTPEQLELARDLSSCVEPIKCGVGFPIDCCTAGVSQASLEYVVAN